MVKLFMCICLYVKPRHKDQLPASPPAKQHRRRFVIHIIAVFLFLALIAVMVKAVFFGAGLEITFATQCTKL
mgnify:CR=1 FL=1